MVNEWQIWGLKTISVFDVWSIEHFIAGISIGAIAIRINLRMFKDRFDMSEEDIRTNYFDIILVLFLAYLWESMEHYLEVGLLGSTVEYWFQGVEYWANRILADPFLVVMGYLVAKSHSGLITPARIGSLIWLLIHIFIFPHSMYLHNWL